MRIAFANWSNRLAGGAETYLQSTARYLATRGHSVSLWHQTADPSDRPEIHLPFGAPRWDACELGMQAALAGLRQWKPDVIYCQGMLDPHAEQQIQGIASSVFFAHNYHGLCISGGRTLHFPQAKPCEHVFGALCLARYYPRRCGGLNPLTMIHGYQINAERLKTLRGYRAVVTHSTWVAEMYRNHGIACLQARYFVENDGSFSQREWMPADHWRLLMMGRMAKGKGGAILIDALPIAAERLDRSIVLTMAGDGDCREEWVLKAERMKRNNRGCDVEFPGWLSGNERARALQATELLALPSVWPEPFGSVGLEAGFREVPSVAFAIGGIPDWLSEGVNGCVADGNPPTASGLADAIVRCLGDIGRYKEMRRNAKKAAERLHIESHYDDIMRVFEGAV